MMNINEQQIREDYRKLTLLLIEKNISITTMESATSGQIASLITDTEGASAIFKGSFVTYSNQAKIQVGVNAEIIEEYSVYSKETACDMARACKEAFGADIGLGITGTMGNVDPANPEASNPGHVYFAIDFKGKVNSYHIELPVLQSRFAYKMAVAEDIAKILFSFLS